MLAKKTLVYAIASDSSTKSSNSSSSGCCSSRRSSKYSKSSRNQKKINKSSPCPLCKREDNQSYNVYRSDINQPYPGRDQTESDINRAFEDTDKNMSQKRDPDRNVMDKDKEKGGSKKSVVVQEEKKLPRSAYIFDGQFLCNEDYVSKDKNKKVKDFRVSRMSIPPIVQPVIGVCTDGRCGSGGGNEKLLAVRYSIVRISTFNDYTTYEVLKSSTKKPKKMPCIVEGIFVTKS